jgi:uncharacterized membrane protein
MVGFLYTKCVLKGHISAKRVDITKGNNIFLCWNQKEKRKTEDFEYMKTDAYWHHKDAFSKKDWYKKRKQHFPMLKSKGKKKKSEDFE